MSYSCIYSKIRMADVYYSAAGDNKMFNQKQLACTLLHKLK